MCGAVWNVLIVAFVTGMDGPLEWGMLDTWVMAIEFSKRGILPMGILENSKHILKRIAHVSLWSNHD